MATKKKTKARAPAGKTAAKAKQPAPKPKISKSAAKKAAPRPAQAKSAAKPAAKKAGKTGKAKITRMPTRAKLEAMKQDDSGYVEAANNPVAYMEGRRHAIFKIARYYHLDVEELAQEGYEVLLTCLRDYTPVIERAKGQFITVMFNTFFGSRMEGRAMELRNRDPEYQARQAHLDDMDDDERAAFRSDPPLLVQHLDQVSPLQDNLVSEASHAISESEEASALRIMRDSYFEARLNDLVAHEEDEKKRAALMHVKVGGVYNFQEIAYHFGVTDSRASQVMNELMDAFYVQRIIDGDLVSVRRDFEKMKFNEKRGRRLLEEALANVDAARSDAIAATFVPLYGSLDKELAAAKKQAEKQRIEQTKRLAREKAKHRPPSFEDVFTDDENEQYPLEAVEMRSIRSLSLDGIDFHPPGTEETFRQFFGSLSEEDQAMYPAIVSEDGHVIDGQRRIRMAEEGGSRDYLCIVRRVDDPVARNVLRVVVNLRVRKPTKTDLYYAISALADLGLSQQKIADAIGTSRTNVLVYAKVRDKASPKMRALFEDGLIQITNASTCADLDEPVQDRVAEFLRRHGQTWSKGAKFNQLFMAAADGKLDALEKKHAPKKGEEPKQDLRPEASHEELTANLPAGGGRAVAAMQSRLETLETTLRDAEVWAQRRESVITSQAEQLEETRGEVEALRRELEAAELMRFGSPEVIEAELRAIKLFMGITERLAGATYSIGVATRDMRRIDLKRKQVLEITQLMDDVAQKLNTLRLEVYNHGPTQAGGEAQTPQNYERKA